VTACPPIGGYGRQLIRLWRSIAIYALLKMNSCDFATAGEFGKNGWHFYGPLSWRLALFWTRFDHLAESRSGNPALIGV